MDLDQLQPPWPAVFALMWEAYLAGTVPVGAVVADEAGAIVSLGRNRIFTPSAEGQLGGTRLAHAEVNALVGLSSARHYPELTLYTALEPCHLCLAAATVARVGAVRYAAADPYAGAVGKLLPSEFMGRQNPLRVEGPLPGPVALLPEVLHLRHMLWRVPDGQGMVPFYRESRSELIDIALRVPVPPQATTLDDAYARIQAAR